MDLQFPSIVTERRVVPNMQPSATPYPYRIALVGEAPGEDEENYRIPFVGRSGQFLDRLLRDLDIDRHRCFVGNVCQVRPPGNRIEAFDWNSEQIQGGLAQLKNDLEIFNPNICVLMGNTPLRAARDNAKVTAWRGSLFRSEVPGPFKGTKCIPTLHPAFVLREFSGYPLLKFDLKRARAEGETAALDLPKRDLLTHLSATELCHIMDTWQPGLRCSIDIEGGLPNWRVNDSVRKDSKKRRHIGWRCVALSARPTRAFAIAWWKFSEHDHGRVLQSFARLMYRDDVPKVLQNSLYDNFVLTFGYGIPIRNVVEDVMLKGWEVYCELRKGLSTQASIWTREPHWKDEEMYEGTGESLAYGCCKDAAVTLEICNAQDSALAGTSLPHYRANMTMLQPLLYMELRGINYDQESANKQIKEVKETGWWETKKVGGEDIPTWYESISAIGNALVQTAGAELRGDKGSLSSDRLAYCLYQPGERFTKSGKAKAVIEWKNTPYPPQYKKEAGRKTEKLTTDIEALLALRRKFPGDTFLNGIIRHRHLEGLLETLAISPDADGRVRCGYNIVGTETGRLTCYTSPTGAGANLQTITKKLRKNYRADPGYDFFQLDLAGADGWTVAAHCKRLGDPTMLEDYEVGLKPAKIIALLYAFGPDINKLDRESLLWWCKKTNFDVISSVVGTGIYDCSKVIQHGTNYLMGIPTMQINVTKKSFKESGEPIYMDFRVAKELQQFYLLRYSGISTWHNWSEATLVASGELTSASGQKRIFFGRRFGKDIHDTVKEFLAHEPQSNTTYATNLAMLRLWKDPENRIDGVVLHEAYDTWKATLNKTRGGLIIEPLHSVHDALCGQYPSERRAWAGPKLRSYFDNPLTIAEQKITIPFEGAYGPSWGETKEVI